MGKDNSDNIGNGYLECEKCQGYYELQPGESPEDFDKCQSGGKLKYIQMLSTNKFDKIDDNIMNKRTSITLNEKRNLLIIILLAIWIAAIPFVIYSHSLTPTPINYKLLGSYNVNNIGPIGTAITIPQGTKNIKIDYSISWKTVSGGTHGLILNAYDTNIGETVPAGASNIIDNNIFQLSKGQNKTGTYYFNNPEIKSLAIEGNGIQGTVNIYTSQ